MKGDRTKVENEVNGEQNWPRNSKIVCRIRLAMIVLMLFKNVELEISMSEVTKKYWGSDDRVGHWNKRD